MDAGVAAGLPQPATRVLWGLDCQPGSYPTSPMQARAVSEKTRRPKGLRRRGVVSFVNPPLFQSRLTGAGCKPHRLRRVASDPTPRRSQRRATPFFSSLLEGPISRSHELAINRTIRASRIRENGARLMTARDLPGAR